MRRDFARNIVLNNNNVIDLPAPNKRTNPPKGDFITIWNNKNDQVIKELNEINNSITRATTKLNVHNIAVIGKGPNIKKRG